MAKSYYLPPKAVGDQLTYKNVQAKNNLAVFNNVYPELIDFFYGENKNKTTYLFLTDCCHLLSCVSGAGSLTAGRSVLPLSPGTIFLIPAHSNNVFISGEMKYICFSFQLILLEKQVFSDFSEILQEPSPDEFLYLLQTMKETEFDTIRILMECALAPFWKYIQNELILYAESAKQYWSLLKYIEQNISADMTVSSIHKETYLPKSALQNGFYQSTKISLKDYISKKLLLRVKADLLRTDDTLQTIAARYRFCSGAYLSDWFLRQTGLRPSVFRIQQKKEV